MSKRTTGVLDKKSRIFYYLDSKFVNPVTVVGQIRSKLLARGILSTSRENPSDLSQFPAMTYAEAEEKDLKMVALYLSKEEASRQQDESSLKMS